MQNYCEWYVGLFSDEEIRAFYSKSGHKIAGFRSIDKVPQPRFEQEIKMRLRTDKEFIPKLMAAVCSVLKPTDNAKKDFESFVDELEVHHVNEPKIIVSLLFVYHRDHFEQHIETVIDNVEKKRYIFQGIYEQKDCLTSIDNYLENVADSDFIDASNAAFVKLMKNKKNSVEVAEIYRDIEKDIDGTEENLVNALRSSQLDVEKHYLYFVAFLNKNNNFKNDNYIKMATAIREVLFVEQHMLLNEQMHTVKEHIERLELNNSDKDRKLQQKERELLQSETKFEKQLGLLQRATDSFSSLKQENEALKKQMKQMKKEAEEKSKQNGDQEKIGQAIEKQLERYEFVILISDKDAQQMPSYLQSKCMTLKQWRKEKNRVQLSILTHFVHRNHFSDNKEWNSFLHEAEIQNIHLEELIGFGSVNVLQQIISYYMNLGGKKNDNAE
ncbi:MAG: hypothetical protein ACRCWQ_07305 [Bacilli bacterium]